LGHCPNPKPDHCTVLSGDGEQLNSNCHSNSPAKYDDNHWDVYVAEGAKEDPSTTTELTDLDNAVTKLDDMTGINAIYQGIDNGFDASKITCDGGISQDRWDYGAGDNDIYVFFDDPCNEIGDLNNCSGVLGQGGHWSWSSCHTDLCGNQWHNALRPYFIMNNGSGCVGANKYTAVLIHEMLHSMGLGHISGTCTAIMNPSICNSPAPAPPDYGVTDLDNDCTDWMYNIKEAIPIKLLYFSAKLKNEEVLLDWATASEENNDYFNIQVSTDNIKWNTVATVNGAGSSKRILNYSVTDKNPQTGESYYRLKQVDFDGMYTYSNISKITYYKEDIVEISPNPFKTHINIEGYFTSDENKLVIVNLSNKVVYSKIFIKGQFNNEIDLSKLKTGIYFLKINSASKFKAFKIIKL